MAKVRLSGSTIVFGLSLLAASLAIQPRALAQPVSPRQEQIATATQWINQAKSAQVQLSRVNLCLKQRDDDLAAKRDVLQIQLADLLIEEQTLSPKIVTLRSEYSQHERNYQLETLRIATQRKEFETMPDRDTYQYIKEVCAEDDFFSIATCATQKTLLFVAYGTLTQLENNLLAAERRLGIALDTMNAEKTALDQSERQLATATAQMTLTRAEINKTVADISHVVPSKSAVEALHEPLQIIIIDSEFALREAIDLNSSDEGDEKAQALSRIAADLPALIERGAKAISQTDEVLGAGWIASYRIT